MTMTENHVELFIECYLLAKEYVDKKDLPVFAESYIERWENAGFEVELAINNLAGEDKHLDNAFKDYFENDIVDNDTE